MILTIGIIPFCIKKKEEINFPDSMFGAIFLFVSVFWKEVSTILIKQVGTAVMQLAYILEVPSLNLS
jgi:hypothetical protein